MRIHIDLDELVIEQDLQLSKARTKKEVIVLALTDFVRNLQRQQLLALRGKVHWDDDIDAVRQH